MKKILTIISAMLLCSLAWGQELAHEKEMLMPGEENRIATVDTTVFEEFSDFYLDTVKIRVSDVVNDVSTIGINFGGTFTGMNFNPSHSQHRDFYPGYVSIMFSHYEKMFDYLPYFGFQVGVAYGHEGYHFKKNKETGNTFMFYKERSEAIKMEVVEVPFLGMIHFDTRNTKIYADFGLYAGYRLSVERFGPYVDPDYQYSWYDSDIRWDYGFQGGGGFGLVFSPFEFTIGAQLRYGLSSIFEPDSQFPEGSGYEDRNKYYYRFAYPLDIMITAGVHIEIGKRYGRTSKDLKREAYEIVYGKDKK